MTKHAMTSAVRLTKAKRTEVVELLKTNQNAFAKKERIDIKSDAAARQGKKDTAVHTVGAGAWWRTGAPMRCVSQRRFEIEAVIENRRQGG